MKKIIKLILLLIIISISAILSLAYIINSNNNYYEKMITKVKKHYNTDNITYINKYNNYYILTTKDDIIVLDNEYKEVLKEKINTFKENTNNYDIIYKTNKIMFEKKELKKDKVVYTYYDAKNGKEISTTIMEK